MFYKPNSPELAAAVMRKRAQYDPIGEMDAISTEAPAVVEAVRHGPANHGVDAVQARASAIVNSYKDALKSLPISGDALAERNARIMGSMNSEADVEYFNSADRQYDPDPMSNIDFFDARPAGNGGYGAVAMENFDYHGLGLTT